MTFKSQIPFLTVPLALVVLGTLLVDALNTRFNPSTDIGRYACLGLWSGYWLISGLIRWNKPYVTIDERGMTVYGRPFSNQPTQAIPWGSMQGRAKRSFCDIRIVMPDGQRIKIPINGMSDKSVTTLLALIDARSSMNAMC